MKMKRHELNASSAIKYFERKLNISNALSKQMLVAITSRKGRFFTILPDCIDLNRIYDFDSGGIATGVRERTEIIILKNLNGNNTFYCVFDDVSSGYNELNENELFISVGANYLNEIYYVVGAKEVSRELLSDCFSYSDAIWHSLCIVTGADCSKIIDKKLDLKNIEDICVDATLVVIGAYDGEGYVFWEPSSEFTSC